jgi:hypothetical protein
MIKKISSQQLIKGMYVCGTDRKWLDTPFLWSKFLIKSDAQIQKIQEYCQFVHLDTQKGLDLPDQINQPTSTKLTSAEILYQQSLQDYDDLLQTVIAEQRLDLQRLSNLIQALLEVLKRYPEPILSLSLQTAPANDVWQQAIPVCVQTLALAQHLKLNVERIQALGQGALLAKLGESIAGAESAESPCDSLLVNILTNLNRGDALIQNRQQAYQLEYKLNPLFQEILLLVFEFNRLLGFDGLSVDQVIQKLSANHNELDTEILAHFLMTINCYPLNSVVELNTGVLGFVVTVNPHQPKQPTLQIVTDNHKQLLAEPMILNLADPLQSQYTIKKLLPVDEPISVLLLDYWAQHNPQILDKLD